MSSKNSQGKPARNDPPPGKGGKSNPDPKVKPGKDNNPPDRSTK